MLQCCPFPTSVFHLSSLTGLPCTCDLLISKLVVLSYELGWLCAMKCSFMTCQIWILHCLVSILHSDYNVPADVQLNIHTERSWRMSVLICKHIHSLSERSFKLWVVDTHLTKDLHYNSNTFFQCTGLRMNESENNPWKIGTIILPALTWGEQQGNSYHRCRICNIELLTGERAGFCCGNGGKYFNNTIPLPPLPPQYDTFINNPDISSMSRVLNLIFSFASMETTHPFPVVPGPPGFLAI